jgi:hypothetical protein
VNASYDAIVASPRGRAAWQVASPAFDGLHQLRAHARAAPPAMHQQLHDLRAMRLVRRPGRVELDRANDTFGIASDEEDCARMGCRKGTAPPVFCVRKRERREKTHGGAGVDGVDQELSEGPEIGITDGGQQSLDHGPHNATIGQTGATTAPGYQTPVANRSLSRQKRHLQPSRAGGASR